MPVPVIPDTPTGGGITLSGNIADPTTPSQKAKVGSDVALLVSTESALATTATLQSAATGTGVGTALSLLGDSSVTFTVTGTFSGTITWQGSEDGTNFSTIYAVQLGTNTISTTATATGTYEVSCSGLQKVQANITSYSSGSITVTGHAIPGSHSARVIN